MSNIDNFEALVELVSQSDNKYEIANPDFSTSTLNIKPKKLPLGIKQLQNIPNGTKLLQNLPNCKKILQIYRTELKHWGVSHPRTPPAKSIYACLAQRFLKTTLVNQINASTKMLLPLLTDLLWIEFNRCWCGYVSCSLLKSKTDGNKGMG